MNQAMPAILLYSFVMAALIYWFVYELFPGFYDPDKKPKIVELPDREHEQFPNCMDVPEVHPDEEDCHRD